MPKKPYAEAAHQNREAILDVLKKAFSKSKNILEIGSGTGQHAVHFAEHLSHLTWQPSDKAENIFSINLWINEANLYNIKQAITLNVCDSWPPENYDGAYAANVVHIMHWHEIESMFAGVSKVLLPGGVFCIYGPFNENGRYTSASNQQFDQWLRQRDSASCIRDKEALNKLAIENHLNFHQRWEMPANNLVLSWIKDH